MHSASANGLNPMSKLPKLGTTSPSSALGGKFQGSQFLWEACMKLFSVTEIFLFSGPIVGSTYCFASCGILKSPVALVSKISIAVRDWYRRPMMHGVYCLLNVHNVETGSVECTICSLVWLVVGVSWADVVVSIRRCLFWIYVATFYFITS